MPPRSRNRPTHPDADQYEAVVKAARSWNDQVLQCRLLGHSWAQDGNARHYAFYRYWRVGFVCTRGCGVTKWEEWDERGLVVGKGMGYPRNDDGTPAYLLEGHGRIDANQRGVLRIETVGRSQVIEIEGEREF